MTLPETNRLVEKLLSEILEVQKAQLKIMVESTNRYGRGVVDTRFVKGPASSSKYPDRLKGE